METINYCQSELNYASIPLELYNNLNKLGLIPNDVREANVGKSNYAKHTIQPWSIWIDYDLNPWDADIVKRILRTKEEEGMSLKESRLMDYEKIIHICKERIRQIELGQDYPKEEYETSITLDPFPEGANVFSSIPIANPAKRYVQSNWKPEKSVISYHLNEDEAAQYGSFCEAHKECKGNVTITFSHESGIGVSKTVTCSKCGATQDITDVRNW